MLSRLVIQDVVLIDKLTVPFAPGLNVLSGETGAGKSILLDALGLALGARSDSGLVRKGAPQASVTAVFEGALPPALEELWCEQGLGERENDELILRRLIAADGKSRAFANDQPISVALLRQIGETLLEVHGQFETHGLLNAATHRGLLDSFCGLTSLAGEVAASYRSWKEAETAHTKQHEERAKALAEEEFLRAAVAELDELAPEDGELDHLTEKRGQLQNREKIFDALRSAEDSLSGDRGAANALAQAGKHLARALDKAPGLAAALEGIDRAAAETEEAREALTHFAHELDADPEALEKIEDRFFKLRAVARKHGVPAETLRDTHESLRARLALLSDQSDQLAVLAKKVMETRAIYQTLALKLSEARAKGGAALAKAIGAELPPLKFERAALAVDLARLPEEQWSAAGIDRVAFLATTNPGATPAPLAKVASGGELARFMLALKVVLVKTDPVPTLVFDEVDSGVGGATAAAVGERLAELGRDVQVLVVTHSPQIAARAAHHLRVEKAVKGAKATTSVVALDSNERIEEIARMLAGDEITEAARQAAMSLIGNSNKGPTKNKRKALA